MVPAIEQIETVPEFIAALQRLRTQAGSPSYAEIASSIGAIRTARGLPSSHAAPGKSTVYEAFKPNRKRLDAALIEDIVAALDVEAARPRQWRNAALRLTASGPLHLPEIVELGRTPSIERFVGRSEELRIAAEHLRRSATSSIVGLPGIGKSALAERVALHLTAEFEEALWVSMRGHSEATSPVDPEALARALLDRWQHTFEATRVTEELQRRLASRRVLLVLDDAVSAAQVKPFLPVHREGARVLVTSRRPLGIPNELQLDPLGHDDSLALLDIEGDEPGAASLVGSCGGIPLALEVAMKRIRERPNWTMADHAAAFERQGDAFDPLHQRIRGSYAALPAELRSALTKLALLPGTQGDLDQARWLLGDADEPSRRILERLAQAGLVRVSNEAWSMHDFVRSFATANAHESTPPSELQQSFNRYVEGITTTTASVLLSLEILGTHRVPWLNELAIVEFDPSDARHWLDTHIAAVFSTAAKTVDNSDLTGASRLSTLMYYLGLVGNDGEASLELQRRTRAVAEQHEDRWEQMRALTREAALLVFRLGRSEEAALPLKWAEDLCIALIDDPAVIPSLMSVKNSQATAAALANDLPGAEKAFRELLPHVRSGPDDRLEFPVIVNLVEVLNRAGKVGESTKLGLDAIERAEELGYDREVLALSLNLTDALTESGDLETAFEISERGVEIAKKLQHQVQLGFLTTSRSVLAMKQGRVDDANRDLEAAKELAGQTRHRELTAFAAQAEARIVFASGDLQAAEEAAVRAVEAGRASADSARLSSSERLLAQVRERMAQS
ncbi:MAG TPA: hypothetical protein H9830_02785 [Candidatus Agrococcus pullicola]|uniref:NB-ARC domain-containing protein n=1 Tax=Candidatus Agrococcus pullicola TaxID=2838429 RepID=A0A9D1YWC1_9MICO|nr:hypothetical protein [Candidatus Agrococcus pullicola]